MGEFQEYDELGIDAEQVADAVGGEMDLGFTSGTVDDAVGRVLDELNPEAMMSDFMGKLSIGGSPGVGDMINPGVDYTGIPETLDLPESPGALDRAKRALAGIVEPQGPLPREPLKPKSEMTVPERVGRAVAGLVEPQDQLPPERRSHDEGVAAIVGHAIAGLVVPQEPLPPEPLKPRSEMTIPERVGRAVAGLVEPQDQLPPDPPEIDASLSERIADSVAELVVPRDDRRKH